MTTLDQDPEHFAPQKLLTGFSKTRIFTWLLASIVLHVVVIGASSPEYLYYHVINWKAGEERERLQKQEEARRGQEEAEAGKVQETRAQPVPKKPARNGEPAVRPEGEERNTSAMMKKHEDKPVIERINETAAPEEIPKQPDDLGLSIMDTETD